MVVVLVAYPLSFGPAYWITRRFRQVPAFKAAYHPLIVLASRNETVAEWGSWYLLLGRKQHPRGIMFVNDEMLVWWWLIKRQSTRSMSRGFSFAEVAMEEKRKLRRWGCAAVMVTLTALVSFMIFGPSLTRWSLPWDATDIQECYSDARCGSDSTRCLRATIKKNDFIPYANRLGLSEVYDAENPRHAVDYFGMLSGRAS